MKSIAKFGIIVAAGALLSAGVVTPASAATCTLFKNGNITTGNCGGQQYFSQKFGKNTFGSIGGKQFNQFDVGNGMSVGTLDGRPMTCIKVAPGIKNCF